ncbi:MAG: bifunctional DNA-binding transcriptional regulator/O6-methylguanine-DNA methyltransferase Ada [Acidobacteriota bacterium]|nr:bifunctional DNA-binding transcriptional regulator/O6-methylguanine-DNA methyltransferase Ada [Acidobacteriota bacterium]
MTARPIPSKGANATNNDAEWQAVLGQHRAWDGRLFYGVRSTGIYCKPSCPSRRPRRDQVEYFFDIPAAERAGFRACKRCHPNQPGRVDAQLQAVERACHYIRENLDATLSLEELGAHAGMSPFHLQRVFKRATGLTPKQYIAGCRLASFKQELRLNRRNVTEATYHAGYSSGSRVYERANQEMGMTPATYRKGAAGVAIEYAVVACSLGRLLVAKTPRGVCSVQLGDSERELEKALKNEFPKAELSHAAQRPAWLADVLAQVEGGSSSRTSSRSPETRLPLDIRVTAFQRRVYEALLRIPAGETRSYQQVAAAIGAPAACRAVARVCARNPVAVVIPCHRVVRGDGALAGYRWGVERKRALLGREAARKS